MGLLKNLFGKTDNPVNFEVKITSSKPEYNETVKKHGADRDVISVNPGLQSAWSIWPRAVLVSVNGYWRRRDAKETIMFYLDKDKYEAMFSGHGGTAVYKTCLSKCTCSKFSNSPKEPCKHIYALFYALCDDSNDFDNGIADKDILSAINTLSEPSLVLLPVIYLEYKKNAYAYKKKSDITDELIKVGFFIEGDKDYKLLADKEMTKDALFSAMAKKYISGYTTSWSKAKIIDWLACEHSAFLEQLFQKYIWLEIPANRIQFLDQINNTQG